MNKGSGRSFAHAFTRHRDFLQGYLLKRGVKPEDVDDLLQETFLRCFQVLRNDPEGEHRKLLTTVIRNLHIDQFRRSRKFATSVHEGFFENLPNDNERRLDRMRCALLEKVLDDIKDRPESRSFKMHYQGGYKIHEIAQLTQTSQGTISSQIFRFRNRMQAAICEQLDAVDEFLA